TGGTDVAAALYRERSDGHRVPVSLTRIVQCRRLVVSLPRSARRRTPRPDAPRAAGPLGRFRLGGGGGGGGGAGGSRGSSGRRGRRVGPGAAAGPGRPARRG